MRVVINISQFKLNSIQGLKEIIIKNNLTIYFEKERQIALSVHNIKTE